MLKRDSGQTWFGGKINFAYYFNLFAEGSSPMIVVSKTEKQVDTLPDKHY